jgi:GTP cyclohydrolase I
MATNAMKKHKGEPVVVMVSSSNACENVQDAAKREKRTATVEVVGLDYRITLE